VSRVRTAQFISAALLALWSVPATAAGPPQARGARFILSMVYPNPGEPAQPTWFNDPAHLAQWGINGQITVRNIEALETFEKIDPELVPAGSPARIWMDSRSAGIRKEIASAHAAGIRYYAFMQVMLLPRTAFDKYESEICSTDG
jgi:hypothetical protein